MAVRGRPAPVAPARPDIVTQSEHRFDLGALFEFSTIINSSTDLRFIFGHLLLTLMGKLMAVRGIVLLRRDGPRFTVETVKGLPQDLTGTELAMSGIPRRISRITGSERSPWMAFFRERRIDVLMPLVGGGKTLGVVGFGFSSVKRKLNEREQTYIKSLTNIAAAAIEKGVIISELSQVNRRLDRKFQELNTLFELGKEFNAVLDPDRLVKLLMFSIMGQVGASKYFVCLQREGGMGVVGSRLTGELGAEELKFLSTLNAPVLVSGLNAKSQIKVRSEFAARGIHVLVPLQLQNQIRGAVGLGEKMQGDAYGPSDLEFLSSLGNLAIIALENARLFREEIEKRRLEDELLIAKDIQRKLLPAVLPEIPCFELAATNISSKQVGGDYYDIIPLGNTRFVLAIGDVSGKGTPASLLMANLQATIRALVPFGLSLSELTRRVNDLVCESTGSDRFITFFWGILDTETRSMKYVSAGHNPPYVFRSDGSIVRLDKGGIILGIMKTMVPYEEGEVTFGPGDVLLLFTDGVSEAMDSRGEEWGEERLEAVANRHAGASPDDLQTAIIEAIREHGRGVPQSDDITLVIAKMKS